MQVGTVRRIDDLGRLVLPKTIRKDLRIKSGDNLEIFVEDKNIIIKKHSELEKIKEIGNIITETLKKKIPSEVYITDKDKFLIGKEKYKNKYISNDILEIINNRKKIAKEEINFTKEEKEKGNILIEPLIINGDTYGALIINSKEKLNNISLEIVDTVKQILIKNLE